MRGKYKAEGSWFRNRPRLLQLSAAQLSKQHRFTALLFFFTKCYLLHLQRTSKKIVTAAGMKLRGDGEKGSQLSKKPN